MNKSDNLIHNIFHQVDIEPLYDRFQVCGCGKRTPPVTYLRHVQPFCDHESAAENILGDVGCEHVRGAW